MQHDLLPLPRPSGPALSRRRWRLETGMPRAALFIVHGIHEHGGRYAYVASQMLLHGIEVHALDLRGHGHSEGTPGRVDSFDAYVEDVALFLDTVRAETDGLPQILLGHSMGGLVTALYVAERGFDLDGLVLSSPALGLAGSGSAPVRSLLRLAARVYPDFPLSRSRLPKLARDERVARMAEEDPLVLSQPVSAGMGVAFVDALDRVWARTDAFTMPLYLFHGTDDSITQPGATERFAGAVPSQDVTLRLYEGGYHETMNDFDRDVVIADLIAWILARVGA